MPLPHSIRSLVARVDMAMGDAFSSTMMIWHRGGHPSIEIDGDCLEPVSLTDGGQIHIGGNLNTDINTGGHHEIIIAGNVASDVVIKCTGFCSMFVYGNFNGTIESANTTKIWISGSCSGTIRTGDPSTHIRICGNFDGGMEPLGKGSLLYLTIDGFAKNEFLTRISQTGYTLFNAFVGASDVEPGIYPLGGYQLKAVRGTSGLSRWVVESRRAE